LFSFSLCFSQTCILSLLYLLAFFSPLEPEFSFLLALFFTTRLVGTQFVAPRLIAAGAVEIESRELVRRLRAAGLRISPAARRAQR